MSDTAEQLKSLIVETLNLQDVNPAEIANDEPLFGGGLDLDSIDALELVVMIEKQYGIVIKDREVAREAFASINALVAFVETHRKTDG